ncbi:NAD(P)-binding protein [Mycena alexandri]|uniref:NAD(P)-binding protein n=1 Tax=Mycena alexandri TaxID=1745969 RepID=A0AAD6TIT6_9AGAR|nr:NAD(P)-binding protein [Mycena alexandri]
MTITQDPAAPLVAVVGATGIQGGSVVHNLAESDKVYRIRAFTRDASKPAAQALVALGVEVVVVSLVVQNKEAVYKAFAGADVAFLVTNFWEHTSKEREINEGKLLIDAAKAGGVSRIIWSGLPSLQELSGGKFVNGDHYDGKAVVTTYGFQCGVPFINVQAGFYGTNLLAFPILLRKQADGSLVIPWPVKSTGMVPFIDAVHDYGLFVRHVLELPVFPDGADITAYGEKISLEDMAKQLGEGTGKKVTFQQISVEEFKKNILAMGLPPDSPVPTIMADAWGALDEFGWDFTNTHEGLPRRPSTWAQFVAVTDWSKVA